MRQILVILGPRRGVPGRRWGRVGLLVHSQERERIERDRLHEGEGSEDAVVGEELHLLQAGGGGGGGGGGARAGVERVRLGAVGEPVLLQLQVSGQGVDVVNDLVTRRRKRQ